MRSARTSSDPPWTSVTGLWAGPLGAWAYVRFGRASNRRSRGAPDRRLPIAAATIAGKEIFGEWITIQPMRDLSVRQGLIAAVKADALSLAAWEVGMYAWMAIARFVIVGRAFDEGAPIFRVMMQVAMLAGFAVAHP